MDNKKLISQDLESTVLGCMLLDSNCFEVSKELVIYLTTLWTLLFYIIHIF